MTYTKEMGKARELRRIGKSISEISNALSMKKSTVSVWCRDIQLSARQLQRLAQKQVARGRIGLLKAAELKRSNRIAAVRVAASEGARDVGVLTRRDRYLLGLGLYWGEGYKGRSGEFGFTNSNPDIVRAFVRWIDEIYGIQRAHLICRVSINARFKNRARVAVRFWAKIIEVPPTQFTKTSLIKANSKKVFLDDTNYYGTVRIKVRKGTTLLRRVLGSIEEIAKQTAG